MIYFAQAGNGGPIKIGYSLNVEERLKALESESPYPLHLLGTVKGTFGTERNLHKRFELLQIKGEWYRPNSILIDFIGDVCNDREPDEYNLMHLKGSLDDTLRMIQSGYIVSALKYSKGNTTEASRVLGIKFRTLRARMIILGIDPLIFR